MSFRTFLHLEWVAKKTKDMMFCDYSEELSSAFSAISSNSAFLRMQKSTKEKLGSKWCCLGYGPIR